MSPAPDSNDSSTELASTGSENITDTTADAATPEAPANGDRTDTVGAAVSTVVNDHDDVSITLSAASRTPETDAVYNVARDIGADGVNVAVAVTAL